MSDIHKSVEKFFDELEIYEDISAKHCYKIFISQTIYNFLDNETKDKAFEVYRMFFDIYRIRMSGSANPFIDLIDILKNYEEKAAILTDKQRDHYVHSVNVFVLGLAIYANNKKYQVAFNNAILDKNLYLYSYDTRHEEFFYRWGIASLFHDVGYPVEIVGRQINKFVGFATDVDGDEEKVKVKLSFANFEEFNHIEEVIPKKKFMKSYFDFYDDCVYIDTQKPIDLLAHKLHTSLGIDLKDIKNALDDFVHVMGQFGFIDHGFYSSMIVLKWYGYLIQCAGYKPEYFFWPVLDSASAILLHNCYRNMLMKKPFNLDALGPEIHPIAYLLILCDELQEWNREAYGIIDKQRTLAARANVKISENQLDMTYITYNGSLPADFSAKKKKLLYNMLDLGTIFKKVSIRTRAMKRKVLPEATDEILPRPELDILEKLAKAIHNLYNEKQAERFPNKPLKYPDFNSLSESLKYSNLRQAMGIPEKIRMMGYVMKPVGLDNPINTIPRDYIEHLAEKEHDDWIAERIATGWVLGECTDHVKKTSPYLKTPYVDLPEDIKQLDRDSIENIPILLERIGMAVYEK